MLCIELEESAGAAGADVDESAGALGEVDCCFEHATRARALRHNKRRLRFIRSPHYMSGSRLRPAALECRVEHNVWTQDPFRATCVAPISSRSGPHAGPLLCLRHS